LVLVNCSVQAYKTRFAFDMCIHFHVNRLIVFYCSQLASFRKL